MPWLSALVNIHDFVQSGLIINIASVASLSPMPETAVYATSKWGLRGWSLSCYEVGQLAYLMHWSVMCCPQVPCCI